MAIIAALLTRRGSWRTVAPRRPGLHLARDVTHFITQNLWFYALFVIQPGQVFALEFTAPLPLLYHEPLGPAVVAGSALILSGNFINIRAACRPVRKESSPA